MTAKERVTEQLEAFDETELSEIEKDLQSRRIKRQLEEEFRLLDELAAPMSQEGQIAFGEAVKRRPLFGDRQLELEPDAK